MDLNNMEQQFPYDVLLPSQLGLEVYQTTDTNHPYFSQQLLNKIQHQMDPKTWKKFDIQSSYMNFAYPDLMQIDSV